MHIYVYVYIQINTCFKDYLCTPIFVYMHISANSSVWVNYVCRVCMCLCARIRLCVCVLHLHVFVCVCACVWVFMLEWFMKMQEGDGKHLMDELCIMWYTYIITHTQAYMITICYKYMICTYLAGIFHFHMHLSHTHVCISTLRHTWIICMIKHIYIMEIWYIWKYFFRQNAVWYKYKFLTHTWNRVV